MGNAARAAVTGSVPLRRVRRLAVAGAALSALALAGGVILVGPAVVRGRTDGGLGEAIALGVGLAALIFGGCGVVLGILLRILATRVEGQAAEIRGLRKILLGMGLTVAVASLLATALSSSGWLLPGLFVAAFALGYLVVATASRGVGIAIVAGVIAIALLGIGWVPLWLQTQLANAYPPPAVVADGS